MPSGWQGAQAGAAPRTNSTWRRIVLGWARAPRSLRRDGFGPTEPVTYDQETMPFAFRSQPICGVRPRASLALLVALACATACAANPNREDKTNKALHEQVEQLQRDYDRLAERVSLMEAEATPAARQTAATPAGLPVVRLQPGDSSAASPIEPDSPGPAATLGRAEGADTGRLMISGTGADLKATEPKPKSSTRPGTP